MLIVLPLLGFERFSNRLPAEQARKAQDRRLGLARHHRYAAVQGRIFYPIPLLPSFHGITGLTPGGRPIRVRP